MQKDSKLQQILLILADGRFHSGEEIGRQLNLTRSAISKLVGSIHQLYFIDVEKISGRGYRIRHGIEFLDINKISQQITRENRAKVAAIEILPSVASTNTYLLNKARQSPIIPLICLAEHQSHGRGRRGRQWLASSYQNLVLSLLWPFKQGVHALNGLSLVVGIAVVYALEKLGLRGCGLKWPNDIYHESKKLAGILVESFIDSLGICYAVIGIGINIKLSSDLNIQITRPYTSISDIVSCCAIRNELAGLLINKILDMLTVFEQQGLAAYQEEWHALDILNGQKIAVDTIDEKFFGIAMGIDQAGALKVRVNDYIRTVHAGEATLYIPGQGLSSTPFG